VRGERVAQAVRVAEEPPHGAYVSPPSADGEEQRVIRACRERRATVSKVARELEGGLLAQWHDAFLAALAANVYELAVEVDVSEVERDGLLASQARRVEKLEERTVAQRQRGVSLGQFEQLLDLGRLRGIRKAPRSARRERCLRNACRAVRVAQARANRS
jgi:hypothetical protein